MVSPQTPIKVAINGALGRVGRRLCILACNDNLLQLVGAITSSEDERVGRPLSDFLPLQQLSEPNIRLIPSSALEALSPKPDVIVDFSTPSGSAACAAHAAKAGIALVIGTTGLSEEQDRAIQTAAQSSPVIYAMNFSIGANLLAEVAGQVARALGEDFNIEVVEAHHNKKVDAPSGTALMIADSICKNTERTRGDLVHGRAGLVGPRSKTEIGMHSLRLGSVIGDHTAHFGSQYERLELTHRALDRDVFAAGALRAAVWLVQNHKDDRGIFTMHDVLFSKSSARTAGGS